MNSAPLQLLIRFGYDGQRFHGVQPQPGFATAGEALLARVRAAYGPCTIHAVSFAARTDAGVHADANWMSCRVTPRAQAEGHPPNLTTPRKRTAGETPSPTTTCENIASRTPDPATAHERIAGDTDDGLKDVAAMLLSKRTVARAIARSKRYRYTIADACDAIAPDARTGAWQIMPTLDIQPMRTAAKALQGTHDFSAYTCRRATGARVKTLHTIDIHRDGEGRVVIDVQGEGFLRYMVRYIVGHLAAVGAGLEPTNACADRLHARALPERVLRAPADGLRLMHIDMALNGGGAAAAPSNAVNRTTLELTHRPM